MTKRRGFKPNNKWKGATRKADSKWELTLLEGVLSKCDFHPKETWAYTIPHEYHPDFKFGKIYIESKGRFVDSAEARKYIFIREAMIKEGCKLVFLFYNPKTPMPQAKRRKDGTKRTMGEWASENNFEWYTVDTVKELFDGG